MIKFLKNIFRKNNLADRNGGTLQISTDNEDNWISIQINFCKMSGVKLNSPATQEMITDTQNKLDYEFPSDFINFYRKANGFVEWDFIGNMFSIWSLEKIVNEYSNGDDKNFIPFCDHSIDLYRIGYLKSDEGVYNDFNQEKSISKTFKDTLRLINEDSELLY